MFFQASRFATRAFATRATRTRRPARVIKTDNAFDVCPLYLWATTFSCESLLPQSDFEQVQPLVTPDPKPSMAKISGKKWNGQRRSYAYFPVYHQPILNKLMSVAAPPDNILKASILQYSRERLKLIVCHRTRLCHTASYIRFGIQCSFSSNYQETHSQGTQQEMQRADSPEAYCPPICDDFDLRENGSRRRA